MRQVDHHKQHDTYILLFYNGPCVFILLALFDKSDQRVLQEASFTWFLSEDIKQQSKHVTIALQYLHIGKENEALHIA